MLVCVGLYLFLSELDIDWIHPWIGSDWVSKNGPMSNSAVSISYVELDMSD